MTTPDTDNDYPTCSPFGQDVDAAPKGGYEVATGGNAALRYLAPDNAENRRFEGVMTDNLYCYLCHITFPAGAKSLHMAAWRDKELLLGLTPMSEEDHEQYIKVLASRTVNDVATECAEKLGVPVEDVKRLMLATESRLLAEIFPDAASDALTAALAHAAEIKRESLNPAFVYDVALGEIAVLGDEVLRLRDEDEKPLEYVFRYMALMVGPVYWSADSNGWADLKHATIYGQQRTRPHEKGEWVLRSEVLTSDGE